MSPIFLCERGTREYNLALGQRRAETVAEYLILNGINKSRITVKSQVSIKELRHVLKMRQRRLQNKFY